MVCINCGAENAKSAEVCAVCGVQLEDTSFSFPNQPVVKVTYAGFWKRFVAYIIDGIILAIAGAIIGGVVGAIIGAMMGAAGAGISSIQETAGFIGYILGLILNWLYFTLLESSARQATFGKQAMSLVVTDMDNKPISFGRANGRYWGKFLSTLILLIGFIMAGFTEKKQALHDILASTLVVER